MIEPAVRRLATGKNFGTLSVHLPNGQIATNVMWVDATDDYMLINTEIHRQKFKSIEGDPRVAVCIWQRDDPYQYMELRGRVVEIVRGEPARQHIDELAMRYFGRPYDETIITSERVILRIRPE
jgi:PPOX class probable F420-dependent enzyme